MPSDALAALLARQDGVVSLAQAVGCGASARSVQRWARDGSWERLFPAVYLAGGHRLTAGGRGRAVSLWAGPDATVTGAAAAFWHRMPDAAPAVVAVTVPASARPRCPRGVRVRRRDLDPLDRVENDRVWVAAPPFAALETAVAGPDGSAFLDRALQRHVGFPTLHRSYCRDLGRAGSREAVRLVVAAADRAGRVGRCCATPGTTWTPARRRCSRRSWRRSRRA